MNVPNHATKARRHEGTARCGVIAIAFCALIAAPAAQAPDRAKPPLPGPAPALSLPAIQKRQLSNGLPVWIVELHEVPVAQINLVVMNGTAADPPGQYGIASLTAAMLAEGAGTRSSLEIADAIEFLGADLSASASIDSAAVRLHAPVTRLADALPIMADLALRPTFPASELERVRQQRLTGLIQARDDPSSIANLAFSRALYGPSHRYGTATMGAAENIKAFSQADLRAFYAATFRPDNATLIVVGDVAPDAVTKLLEGSFGRWKASSTAPPKAALPAAAQPAKREVILVDKPGAAQSQIRIGWIGAPRATPDYFPLQVLNTVLGGSFTSRLNLNLREKRGYSYGAGSSFDFRAGAGPFIASAGVQTDKTSESLTEFFNELNAILQLVPDEELARAKNYVALRFPSGFEATGDISRRLEEVIVYRLPENYFGRYVQNIQAVTAADVQRVAKQYIDPSRLLVMVVGDRKTIEPGVRALNLGPLRLMTIDEVFAAAKP